MRIEAGLLAKTRLKTEYLYPCEELLDQDLIQLGVWAYQLRRKFQVRLAHGLSDTLTSRSGGGDEACITDMRAAA
jgi:hypothetical protein